MQMPEKILVLHSGGLDSTTCLLAAQSEGHEVLSLGVDYGQHAGIELKFAARQCELWNIPRQIVTVEWAKPVREIPVNRGLEAIRRGGSTAFLPGRNAMFLALAVAHAAGVNASRVQIGINCIEFIWIPRLPARFFEILYCDGAHC